MREYSLKFNSLTRYAPNVMATMEDRVHQYVDRLDPYLDRDCTIASLNKELDTIRMQAFAQKLEDERQRRRTQESETGHSRRSRSMGQFKPSPSEFRPQYSNRPPRRLFFYSTAPQWFQGCKDNQFRQRSENKVSQIVDHQE